MKPKLEHWKKLDHIFFLILGIPIILGLIMNINLLFFGVMFMLWMAILIVDQLEERRDIIEEITRPDYCPNCRKISGSANTDFHFCKCGHNLDVITKKQLKEIPS